MRLFSKNYALHRGQIEVAKCAARFRMITAGRRWGKTVLDARLLVAAAYRDPGDYGWIAPSYAVTERGTDAIHQSVNPYAYEIRGMPPKCYVAGGGRIFFHSADQDDPKSILGHGFKGVIVDEPARVPKNAWDVVIRPTLSDLEGWAVLSGTPKGRNWFFDHFTRGQDPEELDYQSFIYPSKSNPHFPIAEWREAKRTLPAIVFRQEYEAEFLEDSAGVFQGIEACLCRGQCVHHGPVVIGVDLAKHQDYTVIIVMCAKCGNCWHIERFNKIDWPFQKEKIINVARKYKGRLIIDSTGVGDPIYDDLRKAGLSIEGIKFTNASKCNLIQGLMVAIEQSKASWPRDVPQWDVLTNELKRYEYKYSKTGLLTYNAPSGYHDDCVIALALCVHGIGQQIRPRLSGGALPSDDEKDKQEMARLLAELDPAERAAMEKELGGT